MEKFSFNKNPKTPEKSDKKPNPLRKGIAKTLGMLGIGAMTVLPGKAEGQTAPYQSKDDKDYKYRKEMYEDSMHAYKESQLSEKMYALPWEKYDEARKLAGVEPKDEKLIDKYRKAIDYYYKMAEQTTDPEQKKKYKKLEKDCSDFLSKYGDNYYDQENKKFYDRFNKYSKYDLPDQNKSHNRLIYTKNKKNKPSEHKYKGKNTSVENEGEFFTIPSYEKPVQKVLPPIKEEVTLTEKPVAQKISEVKEEILTTTPTKMESVKEPAEKTPDLYLMPNGGKYTYEEIIKAYPMMKDAKTFEANFHRKPPLE